MDDVLGWKLHQPGWSGSGLFRGNLWNVQRVHVAPVTPSLCCLRYGSGLYWRIYGSYFWSLSSLVTEPRIWFEVKGDHIICCKNVYLWNGIPFRKGTVMCGLLFPACHPFRILHRTSSSTYMPITEIHLCMKTMFTSPCVCGRRERGVCTTVKIKKSFGK